ncbi:MAG: GntR family transcriptional regulator [Rubrobacteraceae bacterium]|jgi:GntR family transcriptional regulator|nr:GntR family transcriptional regulator [Rubrobacteraceae bacterium]
MDLQINSKSHIPVHVQLEEQIKHLILTGGFAVGSRLPSIRALAGYLRVNRNTVARVISDLEREGYVESRRGSGVYVVEPPVAEEDLKRQEVLERVMELAAARGVSVEDLGYALLARAGVRTPERIPVLFVECNGPELEQYKVELEEQLPVTVEGVLTEDLEDRVSDEELPWRLAVTTFFHVHEVERLMEPRGIETFALLTETTLEGLRKLAELPDGTPVGVIGNSRTCTDNLLRSLEGAGLDHLDFFQIQEDDEESWLRIQRAKVVVCANVVAQRLPKLGIQEGVEVIVQDRTLSKGGVELLGRMLRQASRSTA